MYTSALLLYLLSEFDQNVEYVELDVPEAFPLHFRQFLPNVFYDSWLDNRADYRYDAFQENGLYHYDINIYLP